MNTTTQIKNGNKIGGSRRNLRTITHIAEEFEETKRRRTKIEDMRLLEPPYWNHQVGFFSLHFLSAVLKNKVDKFYLMRCLNVDSFVILDSSWEGEVEFVIVPSYSRYFAWGWSEFWRVNLFLGCFIHVSCVWLHCVEGILSIKHGFLAAWTCEISNSFHDTLMMLKGSEVQLCYVQLGSGRKKLGPWGGPSNFLYPPCIWSHSITIVLDLILLIPHLSFD